MGMFVNRVELIGNLGRDPEIRSTQQGKKIAPLSIATSESWKDQQSGEWRERTQSTKAESSSFSGSSFSTLMFSFTICVSILR